MPVQITGQTSIDIGRILMKMENYTEIDKVIPVLEDIGKLLVSEARFQARSQDIINTGRLIEKIQSRISKTGTKATLTVGPKAVYYAKFQELGARRTPESRKAMFARLRELGRIGDKPAKPGFSSALHAPRPFLKPAFDKHSFRMISMLRENLTKE